MMAKHLPPFDCDPVTAKHLPTVCRRFARDGQAHANVVLSFCKAQPTGKELQMVACMCGRMYLPTICTRLLSFSLVHRPLPNGWQVVANVLQSVCTPLPTDSQGFAKGWLRLAYYLAMIGQQVGKDLPPSTRQHHVCVCL
jgi:hypothetical protein